MSRRTVASGPVGRWMRRWAGLLIFLGATSISVVMSPSVSIWTDESVTISAAERSLTQLLALMQRIDAVHALYYAFMSIWVDVFGTSPFSLRLPSALAAGATALGVYVLARLMTSFGTAVAAGGVAATLPRLTWGGIEARPFIFSALVAVWASVLLIRALRRRTATAWLTYGALALVGVAVNIYLILLLGAHGITVLLRARHSRKVLWGFLITAAGVVAISAPLLLLVRSQQAQLGGDGDRSALSIARKILINQFFLGETPNAASATAWFTRVWQVSAVIACVLGGTAIILAIVRRPHPGDSKADILALTLPFIIVPTALVAGYAVLVSPIYQPRYLTFTAPAAALLIAAGARTLRARWYLVGGICLYGVVVLTVFASQRIPFAKSGSDWSAVAHTVATGRTDGDAVYFAPRYETEADEPVRQTSRRIAQAYPTDFAGLSDVTFEQTGAQTATLDGFSRSIDDSRTEVLDHERVWVVFNQNTPRSVIENDAAFFTDLGYTSEVKWEGPSTTVLLYERRCRSAASRSGWPCVRFVSYGQGAP